MPGKKEAQCEKAYDTTLWYGPYDTRVGRGLEAPWDLAFSAKDARSRKWFERDKTFVLSKGCVAALLQTYGVFPIFVTRVQRAARALYALCLRSLNHFSWP